MAVSADQKAYNKTLLAIQNSANNSAKKIQELVNKSNTEQMTFNQTEAKTARDWEKMMSDSAHQREVSDLKKSGLNPVLSVNNGAQSYTTSAASTSNDSGSSATGAILQGELGAIASLESSRMSSQAQLKAAKQSAAAMRYAAKQSAAAQRYAAQQQAAASIYHSNTQNEINKRNVAAQKWIATNKQPGGLFGFIDKQLGQTGGNKFLKKIGQAFFKKLDAVFKNPGSYFKNPGKITQNNFKLNKTGQQMFDAFVKKSGLPTTVTNRRLAVKAFMFQNPTALKQFNTKVQYYKQQRNSTRLPAHHGYVNAPRRGHR